MSSKVGTLQIVSGNANRQLAEAVCDELNQKLCEAKVSRFANGEIDIKIQENIRGSDFFVFQPTCANENGMNVNEALMELLLCIHTAMLASARRVIAVVPHYGYARQDRKHTSRVPISASAVAKMITEMGAASVVTVDLHCGHIQGFFHACPVADLTPSKQFAEYAETKGFDKKNLVVVAPDAGAVTRARTMCDKIGASRIVTILKRRVEASKVESMQLVGDVQGAVCIIADDMIDTAGTLIKAVEKLSDSGAKEVHAWATHGILTDPACDRINKCEALSEVVVTDTIPQAAHLAKCPKLKVISIAKLLAEAIHRIHNEESMETVAEINNKSLASACSGSQQQQTHGSNNNYYASVADVPSFDVDEGDEWKNFPK